MKRTITIFHSPDADDAFMFYGLACGAISHPNYEFKHELSDIESLNHKALKSELEVTAISVHAYAYLKDAYQILPSGASMGGVDYGPRVVAKTKRDTLPKRIGVPGTLTSAVLAIKMFAKQTNQAIELIPMHFDEIMEAVKVGEIEAGLIIHEGQLTHGAQGLVQILDLGEWWWNKTQLPLPLGVNVVRRDLGPEIYSAVQEVLLGSIQYALNHRKEALEYALSYGRGITPEEADRFIAMYVNEKTIDLGEDGRRSIDLFLSNATSLGLINRDA